VKSNTAPAPAEELLPRRQAKPRTPRQARAVVAEAEVPMMSELPVPMPAPIVEPEPEPEPEPTQAPEPAVETEMAGAAEMPRKRKRPSRPRSRRGKAAALPEDPVIEAAPEPVLAKTVAEEPVVVPSPRRPPGRPRRVTMA
jgi:hypothetical protein